MSENPWREMSNYLKEVETFQTRDRRTVIPIVGKALRVLFGTTPTPKKKKEKTINFWANLKGIGSAGL